MSNLIVLDVSGRKFKTERLTLEESPYFASLLARWDDTNNRQEDGSYFVDADPDTFQHILNFMRRPSAFPLFWTKDKGFDYALYHKLQTEADYFALDDLRDWIRDQTYLKAVKIKTFLWKCNMTDGHKFTNYSSFEILSTHPGDIYGHHVVQEVVFDPKVCVNASRDAEGGEGEQVAELPTSKTTVFSLRPSPQGHS